MLISRNLSEMFGWFRRPPEAPRVAGKTAVEWYRLHRSPQYRDTSWSESLAQAAREITSGDGQAAPFRLVDVLVTDASEAARCVAAIQLSTERTAEAEAALIAALQDESELVRRTAGESLVAIGTVRGLVAVIAGSHHGHAVRTWAARKLAELPPEQSKDAIPALMVLLQYPHINWRTHFIAVEALRSIGDAAIPALVNGLHRGTPQVRQYAAIALQQIGKTPELAQLIEADIRQAGLQGNGKQT